MALNQKAGQKASFEDLDNIPRLMAAYYLNTPDMDDPEQRVSSQRNLIKRFIYRISHYRYFSGNC